MTKKTNKYVSKKFIIVFLAIIIIVGGIWAIGQIKNYTAQRSIENKYKKLNIPQSFIFQKKDWTPQSLDVTEYMTYFYLFSGTSQDAFGQLTDTLKPSGFHVGETTASGNEIRFSKCPLQIDTHYIPVSSSPHYYSIQLPAVGKANVLIQVYDYGKNCLDV